MSLEDGSERKLAGDDYVRYYPRWSPESTRLAYSRYLSVNVKGYQHDGHIVVRYQDQEQVITSPGSGQDYVYDWIDEHWLLGSTDRGSPERWKICRFALSAAPHAETEMREVASDPEGNSWAPRLSPDKKWISFIFQKPSEAGISTIFVVPAGGGEWTRITRDKYWADKPRWSPDGRIIYFISNYDSYFLNIWAIKFDPESGKPIGEPIKITNYKSPDLMISPRVGHLEMSVNENSLILPVRQTSGSIWLLDNLSDSSQFMGR
ncbi:MAG: hypothetical protein WKF84_05510 [Pyrinomonadaceae bacterium]